MRSVGSNVYKKIQMKEFSDYEKKIIHELIRVDEIPGSLTVLGNIIDFELYPNFFIELKSEIDYSVYVDRTYLNTVANTYGSSGIGELIKQLNNRLLYIVRLFQYLEREGQIYFSGAIDISTLTLGNTLSTNERILLDKQFDDKEVINSLYNIARRKIVVTDSLKKFVKNNFKTEQELKQEIEQKNIEKQQRNIERQTKWTAIGILSTLILGLITSIPDFVSLFREDKPIKIESSCCDSLILKIPLDTLKVKIIEFNDTLIVGQRPLKNKSTKPIPLKVEIVKFNDSLRVKR